MCGEIPQKGAARSGVLPLFSLFASRSVDERLFFLRGRRLARLRVVDLPDVARAIVAHTRGHAKSAQYERRGVSFVRIVGIGVNVVVLIEDWKKIVPYLQDGTFNPAVVPVARSFASSASEATHAHINDPDFFNRILRTLLGLFPNDFPTSNL